MTFDITILKKELGLADDCDNCQRRGSKFTGCESEAWAIVCDRLNQLAEDIPMIEYVPVRHGRWIPTEDPYFVECSECGAVWDGVYYKHCPNCGARMDGDENEIG